MNVHIVKGKVVPVNGGIADVSLDGVTKDQLVLAGWLSGQGNRWVDHAELDGLAMRHVGSIVSGDNRFDGSIFDLNAERDNSGVVRFTLNATASGDAFVLALTPSTVMLYAKQVNDAAATTHHCAPAKTINASAQAMLLAMLVQDVGTRAFLPNPDYKAITLAVTSHLLQFRELTEPVTGERATATSNNSTASEGMLIVLEPVGSTPEPPPAGTPRIFSSYIFGG